MELASTTFLLMNLAMFLAGVGLHHLPLAQFGHDLDAVGFHHLFLAAVSHCSC